MFFLCFRALSTQQGGYVRTTNIYYYYYYYYLLHKLIPQNKHDKARIKKMKMTGQNGVMPMFPQPYVPSMPNISFYPN